MNPSGNAAMRLPTAIRETIEAEFHQVAREQGRELDRLSDDLVLADCDLDSLCFAIIVARLEDRLGFDPFSLAEDAEFPATFGDFVAFYETFGAAGIRVAG
jgi:acyl carrier protein